ncbi:MAG: ABC transporter substrate-binding protein [Candidatus Tectomicrobia bacterium]|uniref:ABC transporter substrate-binding protein n=1 Tax=Tectimicrobiota bacterium TaxID=2528274 RepID=A0A932HWB4_UNCTE|nr:ABC transporter substrate-binding protein [Candidatus Tectomicrobia bacterium]
MKPMGKWWLGAALAFCTLAAGWGAESAGKFRIGIHRSVYGSYEVVADRMGYWKAEGLDYTVQYFKQGKLMRNAVIQDNLDVGTTGFSPFVTAQSKGAQVTGIAVTADTCAHQRIMVLKNSPLKSVKELRGKTVATSTGTSVDLSFKTFMLPAHGLTEKDLKWISVVTTDRVPALMSGNADAAIVGDPQGEIALQKGLVRAIDTFCPYDRPRLIHIGNPQTLKENPERYVKFFKGWLKAQKLLREEPEKFAKSYHEALQEVGDKTEYKVALAVVKRLTTEPLIGDEIRKNMQDIARTQKKLGWIKSEPDFIKGKMLDDTLLRKAASSLAN